MAKDEKDTDIATALDRLAQIAEAQQTVAQATANQLKPKSLEVAQVAQRSPFNPRGEKSFPMPRLKCEIYAPWKQEPNHHNLTREEVELFNLLDPGEYEFELNDGSPARMTVVGDKNAATGVIEKLRLTPEPMWNNEHKGRFRSMAETLRQMLGDRATPVRSMKREQALIADGQLAVSVNG